MSGDTVTWWCSSTGQPWSWEWQAYPGAWILVAACVAAYLLVVRRVNAHTEQSGSIVRERWWFGIGLVTAWIALDWPVGALGAGYLLSVHQAQYVMLVMIAAPLMLLGMPRPALQTLCDLRFVRSAVDMLARPLVAIVVVNAIVILTHLPTIVDALMVFQLGSFLLDMAWLLAGFVLWWPVLQRVPERWSLSYPARFVYLLVATLVPGLPSAFLFFARFPVYSTYELAPPMALSTMDDQFIAGIVMKLGSFIVILIALSTLFYRWHAADRGPDQKLVMPEPTFGSRIS